MMKWKTIDKVSEETGFSQEAIRALKKKGVLRQFIHWIKAPNGRIVINSMEFERWIEGK